MKIAAAIYTDSFPFNQLNGIKGTKTVIDPKDLNSDDILLVHGGEDISPTLYGKAVSNYTYAKEHPSRRDVIEWNLMQRAKELNIPIIGICRGAQMLCALAGGTLIQHVNGHGGGLHEVRTNSSAFMTNSCHHQMMNPTGTNHEVIAWTSENLSDVYFDVNNEFILQGVEPEYVYFPSIKGFAMQWHPEWMDEQSEATEFLFSHIEKELLL